MINKNQKIHNHYYRHKQINNIRIQIQIDKLITTNTLNDDTRTINTINSPPPQQEITTDVDEQTDQHLQTDNVQPLSTQTSSARSNKILQTQNQNFDTDITIYQPSTSLYPTYTKTRNKYKSIYKYHNDHIF